MKWAGLWAIVILLTLLPARSAFSNDELWGLIRLFEHDQRSLDRMNSLSVEDLEWLLYEVDAEKALRAGADQLMRLIYEGIDQNRSEIGKVKLAEYMNRVVEVAQSVEKTWMFAYVYPYLNVRFDHPVVHRYLKTVEQRGGVKALTRDRPQKKDDPFAGD